MSNMEDRLVKMREERAAREKARIEKLREMNFKKYIKNEAQGSLPNKQTQKLVKSNSVSQIKNNNAPVKNNFHVNGTTKRPVTAPTLKKPKDFNAKTSKADTKEAKTNFLQKNIAALKSIDNPSGKITESAKDLKLVARNENRDPNIIKKTVNTENIDKKPTFNHKINNDKLFDRKSIVKSDKVLAEIKPFKKIDPKLSRKSNAVFQKPTNLPAASRKSLIPKIDSSKESVFERLYKPKFTQTKTFNDVAKLQTDPNYLKKVIKNSGLILKRHTCFDTKETSEPVRRSISAVHFKRIGKNELGNCIHKWASIGDKLNNQHLAIDEGESIKEDKVVSAVKSERKKVKFMTPMSRFVTPRPEELQARLRTWLQKRGKSLDAYQHLQCFGIHHLPRSMKPLYLEATPTLKTDLYKEENKENIAVDSDSDDGSYTDNMIDHKDAASPNIDIDKWRQTSLASESMHTDFNETADLNETTVTSADSYANLDDLVTGALNELAELLKEGFDWEQSARYLRAIRSRFPEAPRTAAYWECRAALEERRGDLHASVQCWEEAIAKGTERNVVESNLDTLLNKFMQLKISPRSSLDVRRVDPKMVDVKNVFKSTIIRFAVQQAKLRQSEAPVFTVTPVRRSGRLSQCPMPRGNTPRGNTPRGNMPRGNTPRGNMPRGNTQREPLRLCDSVKQVREYAPKHFFTPNENLVRTP